MPQELAANGAAEVLEFLGERPVHTVIMSGLIQDNGLESPQNRGRFFAYRGRGRALEGVALIGHATLIEARSEEALAAFALITGKVSGVKMILGEQDRIERFWKFFSAKKSVAHFHRQELLFEQRWPLSSFPKVAGLRPATIEELELVAEAHGRMAEEELGVNPLIIDPEGFRQRCARRIRQERVWVWIRNERLMFKADVVAATAAANYLEGVYVDPKERGKGYGARCLAQLTRCLLKRTQAVCLLVNEHNRVAQGLSRKAGYTVTGCYQTIFLRPPGRSLPGGVNDSGPA
jgi:ribosomal protein S18 acetylase RimI-like enzyme